MVGATGEGRVVVTAAPAELASLVFDDLRRLETR
jgi:hypothetical protein